MEQKDTLLDIMLMAHKISNMDKNVNDVIDRLSNNLPPENYAMNPSLRSLEESILNTMRGVDRVYINYILSFVDKMTFIDSAYIRKTLELRRKDGQMTVELLSVLLDEDLNFLSDGHTFEYYHSLSNLAITLGNSEVIKKAIDRVQSI